MKKRKIFISLLAIMSFLLASCQSVDERLTEKAEIQEVQNSKSGITLTAEEKKYETSANEISVMLQNDGNTELQTGEHLFLEKKVDDIWYTFPYKEDMFSEVGVAIPPGQSTTFTLLVNQLKYKLTPGKYRFVKAELAAPFEVVE